MSLLFPAACFVGLATTAPGNERSAPSLGSKEEVQPVTPATGPLLGLYCSPSGSGPHDLSKGLTPLITLLKASASPPHTLRFLSFFLFSLACTLLGLHIPFPHRCTLPVPTRGWGVKSIAREAASCLEEEVLMLFPAEGKGRRKGARRDPSGPRHTLPASQRRAGQAV